MKRISKTDIKDFLDRKSDFYNKPAFITEDPVSIPHCFSKNEDIEIAAFLTATISWGQRPVILKNSRKLMELMEHQPHDFIINSRKSEMKKLAAFVHRTFNGTDLICFVAALKLLYKEYTNLENLFYSESCRAGGNMQQTIGNVRKEFFKATIPGRTGKHFSDPLSNSAAKRINMMLRWLIRKDKKGVDFGIWKSMQPSQLYIPLDVHSGRVARKLGLLKRKQDDWKAVEELTAELRKLDAEDPVKYDFALFGLGIYENL